MGTYFRSLKSFTSTRREVMRSTFADMRHLKSLRARLPDLYDFIQDPGHHQQPCVYIRLSPWHSPYYIGATDQDVLRREHSRCRKYLQLLRGQHALIEPALHSWKRSNNYWLFCAVPIEIRLPTFSVWVQESKWQRMLHPHLNAFSTHRLLGKLASVNIWLTSDVIRYHRLRHYPFTSGFGGDCIPIYIVNCGLRGRHPGTLFYFVSAGI